MAYISTAWLKCFYSSYLLASYTPLKAVFSVFHMFLVLFDPYISNPHKAPSLPIFKALLKNLLYNTIKHFLTTTINNFPHNLAL
ncbi:hypothetical protein FKM82_006684 [Ascaphus truei]